MFLSLFRYLDITFQQIVFYLAPLFFESVTVKEMLNLLHFRFVYIGENIISLFYSNSQIDFEQKVPLKKN